MTGIDDPYEAPEQPELLMGGDSPATTTADLVVECLKRTIG
jgi:adenylylsulfate kinase-like enzyme